MKIFDGHNDTLLHMHLPERGGGRSFFDQSDLGHPDLPRALKGGFGGGLFAVFVPSEEPESARLTITDSGYEVQMAPPVGISCAQQTTLEMTASLFRIETESEGRVKVARTADELAACLYEGRLAAVLHFEGAEAIDPELDALEVFYRAGLRSLGVVWSRPNAFGYGVPFKFPHSPDTGPGLTGAGRRLVQACNRLGIMVDLSHLNEQGFWEVADISDAPLVATHSAAHALCPSTRNLTDAQLDAIRDSDGMVGLTFEPCDLRGDGRDEADTPLEVVLSHVDYLLERLGTERVGFGSDFDGATMPRRIGDAAGLPELLAALRKHGYDDDMVRKLAHENWLRVLRQTWHEKTAERAW